MRKLSLAFIVVCFGATLFAQPNPATSAPSTLPATPAATANSPAAELSLFDAAVLGVIEGVTEFLPVSSTGHLIVGTQVLGLNSNQPLFDRNGEALWYKKPSSKHTGQLLTLKLAADTYIVVIQFGAIAAVALLYWSQLLSMLRGLFGKDPAGLRLLINVMIAFVPAAGLGFLFHDWIDEHLFSVQTVITAQIVGALLMFYAEYWYGKRVMNGTLVTKTELSPLGAARVGILQCAALCPGTSRSMMTIVGGYFGGLDPRLAAEFSFILGFVTLTAASIFKSYKSGAAMIEVFGWPHVLFGAAVAAVTAAVCVRFLVHWLMRHGLAVFAWYRIVMAGVIAAYFYL